MNTTRSNHELIVEFNNQLDINKLSKDAYYRVITNFLNWLSANHLNNREIKTPSIIKWINYLNETKRARTRQNYIVIVKKFFKFLHLSNYHQDVTYSIKTPSTSYYSSTKKSLTIEQSKYLLNSISKETTKGKRDYAIVFLMLSNALRSVEISRLTINDLDEDSIMVWGKGYKRADKTKLSIKPQVFEAIQSYLLDRTDLEGDRPLFTNMSNASKERAISPAGIGELIKIYLENINLKEKGMSAHSLRHTAALIAYESGLSLEDLRVFMRHKDIRTTQEYFKSVEDQRKADNKASGVIIEKLLN